MVRLLGVLGFLPLTVLFSATVSAAPADGFWARFQLHGFASQTLVQTTENRWFGNSTATSFDFTELGVNASLRLTPRLLLSGQLLSRRSGVMNDGTPALDYGLLDFTPVATPAWRISLRAGRLKNPLGLYNETRDVPFTRPGIFLPQVVYQDRVRNLMLSTDGAMLYGEHTGAAGSLSITLGYGQAVLDQNVETSFLNLDWPGRLRVGTNTALISAWYATPEQRLRLGLSGIRLGFDFVPNRRAMATLADGEIDVLIWIASAQYNTERWTLSAEYSGLPIDWSGFGPLFPDLSVISEGFYFQGSYRPRPDLELMLRFENGVADREDRSGARFSRAASGMVPPHFGFTQGVTAGLRWDFSPHWMLRAEYGYYDGAYVLSQRENPNLADQERYWNLFALSLSYRF